MENRGGGDLAWGKRGALLALNCTVYGWSFACCI